MDLTASITVDQTPDEALAAINDFRGWCCAEVDARTAELGAEFKTEGQ